MDRWITEEMINDYKIYLYEQEKSKGTIAKYMRDLQKLVDFVGKEKLTKLLVVEYKEHLKSSGEYKTSSINSFIVAANRFFEYLEWYDLKIRTFKIQKDTFIPENRELSREEYKKLVETAIAQEKNKIALILQTICATGIRVSELSAITVATAKKGMATISNKGKERQILIPRNLQLKLIHYIKNNDIQNGCVFRTSSGKAVDRTWIWREMKKLCEQAGVDKEKVFPHNLRHLFARSFYSLYKDIAKLADMLGHSSIETTRIYLKESFSQHRKHLDKMNLIVGT